jgi:hypothetical protein
VGVVEVFCLRVFGCFPSSLVGFVLWVAFWVILLGLGVLLFWVCCFYLWLGFDCFFVYSCM